MTGLQPVRLVLPVPPSGNSRNEGQGRATRNTAVYLRFKGEVMEACNKAGVDMLSGPVHSVVHIFYHPSHEPDCDNILKTVHDALQGWAYDNDSQIVSGSYSKWPDKRNPRVEVIITAKEGRP